jgi:hypothetical protein
MGLTDGYISGSSLVADNGPPSGRFNLVIVSEGFQAAELPVFSNAVDQFVAFLFSTPPFGNVRCAFNIYRIDVASAESGADDPAACGGDGSVKATCFDASFCNGGIRRLLCVNSLAVIDVVDPIVPEWHQILVIVNSAIYGGSGGNVAVTSMGGSWKEVALHEMGHTIFGLADEYPYWAGCAVDTGRDHYPGIEPGYPNVSINTDRDTIKWKDMIDSATPIPTTSNPDCSKCDTQVNPLPPGTVGLYEGAFYYHCGIYRPEYSCMMRDLTGFCSVCRKRISDTLSAYMEKCYAPVFRPVPSILALFVVLFLTLILIILLVIAPFAESIRCLIKKIKYIILNCTAGNDNPCISL